MADLVITAVKLVSGQVQATVPLDDTCAVGEMVYLTAASKYKRSDAGVELASVVKGILLVAGVAGEIGVIAKPGSIVDVGAVLVVGKVYVASNTPGKIKPVADLTTGDFSTIVGIALTTSQLEFVVHASQVVVA